MKTYLYYSKKYLLPDSVPEFIQLEISSSGAALQTILSSCANSKVSWQLTDIWIKDNIEWLFPLIEVHGYNSSPLRYGNTLHILCNGRAFYSVRHYDVCYDLLVKKAGLLC